MYKNKTPEEIAQSKDSVLKSKESPFAKLDVRRYNFSRVLDKVLYKNPPAEYFVPITSYTGNPIADTASDIINVGTNVITALIENPVSTPEGLIGALYDFDPSGDATRNLRRLRNSTAAPYENLTEIERAKRIGNFFDNLIGGLVAPINQAIDDISNEINKALGITPDSESPPPVQPVPNSSFIAVYKTMSYPEIVNATKYRDAQYGNSLDGKVYGPSKYQTFGLGKNLEKVRKFSLQERKLDALNLPKNVSEEIYKIIYNNTIGQIDVYHLVDIITYYEPEAPNKDKIAKKKRTPQTIQYEQTQERIKERLKDEFENYPDFIPFILKDLRTDIKYYFRAYISALSDSITPEWSSTKYLGNPMSYPIYNGISRTINLSLKIYALHHLELESIWRKAKELAWLVSPSFDKFHRMIAPYISLTLGDLYRDVPGYLQSITITIPDNVPWEIDATKEKKSKVPMGFETSLQFTYLGNEMLSSEHHYFDTKENRDLRIRQLRGKNDVNAKDNEYLIKLYQNNV